MKTYGPAVPYVIGALAVVGLLVAVFTVADEEGMVVSPEESGALVAAPATLREGAFEPRLSASDAVRIARDYARIHADVGMLSFPTMVSQGLFTGQPEVEGSAFATDLPVRVVVLHGPPQKPRGRLAGTTYFPRYTMLISDQTGQVVYGRLAGIIIRPTPTAPAP